MADKKIIVGRSDEATVVAEKIIEAEGSEVILSIPRFSKIGEAGANFRLLHREAEALGKRLTIETVDESVASFAKANGIESRNPFFNDSSVKRFSDIVTGKPDKPRAKAREVEEAVAVPVRTEHRAKAVRDEPTRNHFSREDSVEVKSSKRSRSPLLPSRPFLYFAVGLIVLVLGGILGFTLLPRASITIVSAKTDWSFAAPIAVQSSLAVVDPTLRKIPGQIFRDEKNSNFSFPASGSGKIARKATGRITIWNAHSTAPQPLLEQTRFMSPDGKIFRLTRRVVVPGATLQNGKIIPASIEAEVAADKAGEAGNIGPVSRFTIPGFAGTAKANTFYAESKTAMTGGFVGNSAFPTKEDIEKAKAEAAKALEDSMQLVLLTGLDPSFKVVEGATTFKVTSQRVNEATDASGKFSVFTEGEMTVMAFREADVLELLSATLLSQGATGFTVKSYELKYGAPTFGAKGDLTLPIDYKSTLAKSIDVPDLRERVRGKSEADLRSIIFSLPGVESAKVALWPFWVRWIPGNESRITVTVD